MAKLVSKTYGDALFAVALEEDRMDEFFEAGKVVTEVLCTNEEFGKLMNHPKIIKEEGSQTGTEGCLSVPGEWGEVERPQKGQTYIARSRYSAFLLERNLPSAAPSFT